MSQVVVVIGGGPLSPRAVEMVAPDAFVIGADGGLDHAVAAGLRPGRLVGDMDSVSASGRMWAYAHGAQVDEFPQAKDLTDTELALDAALDVAGADELLVLGGQGDRLDHVLGTLLALGRPALFAFRDVRAVLGDTVAVVVRPGRATEIEMEPGQLFSVLALHGPCRGVTVRGGTWDLRDDDLAATEARGVSNVAGGTVVVSAGEGVLTVVVP